MSSPITAIVSCSKLSAHISFGNLSIKEIFQMANKRIETLKNNSSKEKQSLDKVNKIISQETSLALPFYSKT